MYPPSPPLVRGEDTLAGWRGWGVNNLEDARHSSVLYIRKYFVVQTITCMGFRQPSHRNGRMAAGGPREGAPARRPIRFSRRVRLHGGLFVGWPPVLRAVHYKKRLAVFPIPAGISLIFLPGNIINYNYSRSGRVWSVTSQLGTGKPLTFFSFSVTLARRHRKGGKLTNFLTREVCLLGEVLVQVICRLKSDELNLPPPHMS